MRFALEAGNTIAFTWDIQSGEVRRSSNAETHIALNPYTALHTFEETVISIVDEALNTVRLAADAKLSNI